MAAECAEDLADDGVVYAEIRFAPELHLERRLDSRRGRRGGARRLPQVTPDGRIQIGVLAHRHAHGRQLLRDRRADAAPPGPQAWSGFDIAGSEAGHPPTRHLDAFRTIAAANHHITIHAGEAFGLPSIWEAIQICGAERLGHGVRIVDDIEVQPDGACAAGPVGRVRARPARAARDVPDLERAHRRGRRPRRPPHRPAHPPAVPGHGQHRQPADERHHPVPASCTTCRHVRLRLVATSSGSRSTP